MGDTVVPVATKRGRGRKVLKDKTASTNEANIIAGKVSESSVTPISPSSKQDSKQQSFEKELLQMKEMLQQMRLDKEKIEELLKAKDEALKQKDKELENRGREQEKLQVELKKLAGNVVGKSLQTLIEILSRSHTSALDIPYRFSRNISAAFTAYLACWQKQSKQHL